MLPALKAIKNFVKGAKIQTPGLADKYIKQFERDPALIAAINNAASRHMFWQSQYGELLKSDELTCIRKTQERLMNFYDSASLNPYVALSGQGPWIITTHGAVIYDVGGYGMLGFGHNPPQTASAMSSPQVMANIMTPSLSQLKFQDVLRREIGHSRTTGCPYEAFICLNSGSECVGLAMRIMDADARKMTAPDGPHPGWETVLVSLKGSFHGRTDRPAQASDSSQATYRTHLQSFQKTKLRTVIPNDIADLRAVFEDCARQKLHVEGMLIEPVMGEGNPGLQITREFYDEARRLTDVHRSTLLIDSIQAGFRTTGCLSIMDYPNFENAAPPDFETYSKALSAGQYPLSLLALGPRIQEIYAKGLYGNTMTTNPRALDVATAVLEEWTPEMRANVREQGLYMKHRFEGVSRKFPKAVTAVSGTGLLVATHLGNGWKAYGDGSVEQLARRHGLGVIHGGKNALRFTPHFKINAMEIDLVAEVLEEVLAEYAAHNKLATK